MTLFFTLFFTMLTMAEDLMSTLSDLGEGIGDLFSKIITAVAQFFYTPGVDTAPGQFTIVGLLVLAAVVISLCLWVLRLILRLFKLRG